VPLGIEKENLSDEHRVLPGEGGAIPINEILLILKEIGYKGYISVELFNKKYWEMNPRDVIERALMTLNKILSLV